jgi:hypothetical protein
VLQSVLSVLLLGKLNENDSLLSSDYFKTLDFGNETTKQYIEEIRVGNQGMLLMWLYALLVIPKELLKNQPEIDNEFRNLNSTIEKLMKHSKSTYKKEQISIDYIRHIRNAVSHASVEYFPDKKEIVFKDKNPRNLKETFEVTIPFGEIMTIINALIPISQTYLNLLNQK